MLINSQEIPKQKKVHCLIYRDIKIYLTKKWKKKQQKLDNIENTKKKEHNKSVRPKKNNVHTVTSDNGNIVASNKIHL